MIKEETTTHNSLSNDPHTPPHSLTDPPPLNNIPPNTHSQLVDTSSVDPNLTNTQDKEKRLRQPIPPRQTLIPQ